MSGLVVVILCYIRLIWGFPARHGGTPLSLDAFFHGK